MAFLIRSGLFPDTAAIISLVQFLKYEEVAPRIYAADVHEGEAFVVCLIASLGAGGLELIYGKDMRILPKAFQKTNINHKHPKGNGANFSCPCP